MRICSKCKFNKPFEAFIPAINTRSGYLASCGLCTQKSAALKYLKNKTIIKIKSKAYYLKNSCRIKQRALLWKKKNTEQKAYKNAQWAKLNCEKSRQSKRNWKLRNPGKVKSDKMLRYITQVQATPRWLSLADKQNIEKFYAACPKGWHVDHVVPLRGAIVSGLHILTNLQYLPAIDNIRKSNKFE